MPTRVEADLLIPGDGEPIRNGCVIFDASAIHYAGPIEGVARPGPDDVTVSVPVVMPGLWDCHTHFTGLRNVSIEEQFYSPYPVSLLRSTREAERALRAGFTSIRELAGNGIYLRRAVNEGTIPGPHIYSSATALSTTGGHGDIHPLPIEFVHFWQHQRDVPGPCDGVPECLAAVRKVLRLGASVVKVCASGGVFSDVDDPRHQQFSDEELRAIVEEATRAERLVAAHCHGKAGIIAALRAGAKSIEHGTYMDEEAADLMVEKGAILCPTLTMKYEILPALKEQGVPEPMAAKARVVAEHVRKGLRIAYERKVRFALGTDIGLVSETGPAHWGGNGHEFAYMVEEIGMTPLEAVHAGTAIGPLTLGPQAPKSGQLRAGFASDVITIDENPLKRIAVLGEPDHITHVWKDGRLAVDRSRVEPAPSR